ncbi:HD domain-containing phosphohydrolase [Thiohalomonas denitrificans]|uniref:HDIG domain-containing protein n=1 Tax=Thiohalomonas denitrificans TaxID=415747 RepID=A0A1G5QUP9_9GAMM|nr:HD domain-containing phosphohydrolase [Thiohalomonas denitrificans]SCZ65594.1 HDIG domain-containing protein [Thiohalomonas denitrificans]
MRSATFGRGTVNLLDLVISISTAIDLVAPEVGGHQKRVAYMALGMAQELGWSAEKRQQVVMAGLLHDIGALSRTERHELLCFEDGGSDIHRHGKIGYLLLRKFRHFFEVADIVRHHHMPWQNGANAHLSEATHLLHLADRLDTLVLRDQPVLSQVERISRTVSCHGGSTFHPEHVEAFMELGQREYFWLDVASPSIDQLLRRSTQNFIIELDWDDLQDFAELLAHVIDFRSRFTATHSSGVAAVSAMLADMVGFSAEEREKIKVAGYLHDIGKLAISSEILEKPGRLSQAEFQVIKSHAYYTYHVLESIQGLEEVAQWAAFHHERLDGSGYPGRRQGHRIPLGARIVAVADMFTALSERRPYRGAACRKELASLMEEKAARHVIDRAVVGKLLERFKEVDRHRARAQAVAAEEYDAFLSNLHEGLISAR